MSVRIHHDPNLWHFSDCCVKTDDKNALGLVKNGHFFYIRSPRSTSYLLDPNHKYGVVSNTDGSITLFNLATRISILQFPAAPSLSLIRDSKNFSIKVQAAEKTTSDEASSRSECNVAQNAHDLTMKQLNPKRLSCEPKNLLQLQPLPDSEKGEIIHDTGLLCCPGNGHIRRVTVSTNGTDEKEYIWFRNIHSKNKEVSLVDPEDPPKGYEPSTSHMPHCNKSADGQPKFTRLCFLNGQLAEPVNAVFDDLSTTSRVNQFIAGSNRFNAPDIFQLRWSESIPSEKVTSAYHLTQSYMSDDWVFMPIGSSTKFDPKNRALDMSVVTRRHFIGSSQTRIVAGPFDLSNKSSFDDRSTVKVKLKD